MRGASRISNLASSRDARMYNVRAECVSPLLRTLPYNWEPKYDEEYSICTEFRVKNV